MKLFNTDGGFYKFISRFFDLVKLNFLWLLFCLPVITIGASTTAAYGVALKMVDDEESYIARSFVREFKRNFKQGTVLGLIFIVATYAIYLDYEINRISEDGSIPLIVIGILSAFIYVSAMLYSFPLLARYENSVITGVLVVEFVVFNFNSILQGIGFFFGGAFGIFTVAAFAKRIFQEIEKGD